LTAYTGFNLFLVVVGLVATRIGYFEVLDHAPVRAYRLIASIVTVIAVVLLVVWLSIEREIYWPVAAVAVGAMFAWSLVMRGSLAFWIKAREYMDGLVFGGAVYLWVRHWPF